MDMAKFNKWQWHTLKRIEETRSKSNSPFAKTLAQELGGPLHKPFEMLSQVGEEITLHKTDGSAITLKVICGCGDWQTTIGVGQALLLFMNPGEHIEKITSGINILYNVNTIKEV